MVRVKTVEDGGPAGQAGIKEGDIILKANGKDIRNLDDLATALQGLFAGDSLKLAIKRGEETLDITVQLGKRP